MENFDIVPKYLESIMYAEADLEENYRMNRNERNRIQHGLIHLAMNKVFNSWRRGCENKETGKILGIYIQKLLTRSALYRLRWSVGYLRTSKIKYEATRSAILILLDIYKMVELGTMVTV